MVSRESLVSGSEKDSSDKRLGYKALVFTVIGGLAFVGPEIKEAVGKIIDITCIKNSGGCKNSAGKRQFLSDTGDTYIVDSDYFDNKSLAHSCEVSITKNGRYTYVGPMDHGKEDTVDMETRCGKIFGTKYYPDHTDSSPHYDRGEWKDGKKHGKIIAVRGSRKTEEKWENGKRIGIWAGTGGLRSFMTEADIERYRKEREYREAQEREKAERRARERQSNTSFLSYDWNRHTGEFTCNGVHTQQNNLCREGSYSWSGADYCRQIMKITCGDN